MRRLAFAVGSVSLLLLPATARATSAFATAVDYDLGTQATAQAIGDFNGDGNPDVAIANFNGGSISIYLGSANGTFTAASTATIPNVTSVLSVAAGDVNGDHHVDLLAAGDGVNGYVFLGDGHGGFQAATGSPFTVAQSNNHIYGIAIGDLNNDTKADAVFTNFFGGLNVFLGDGTGAFTQTTVPPLPGNEPNAVKIVDVNGDSKPDLVTPNYNRGLVGSLGVLLGANDGTFSAATGAPFGINGDGPTGIAVGYIDGDAHLDVVLADDFGTYGVSVLLGAGDGTFTATGASPIPITARPEAIALADFDADGHSDFATVNADGSVSVFAGAGDGTFTEITGSPFASGSSVGVAIDAVDVNRDGAPDLLVSGSSGDLFAVLLNQHVAADAGAPHDAGTDGESAIDGSTPVDSGATSDAGVTTDASAPLDAGASLDAGTPLDAGTSLDASSAFDATVANDAGEPVDASVASDSGTAADSSADAAPATDGSTETGTGNVSGTGGCGCRVGSASSSFSAANAFAWLCGIVLLGARRRRRM